MFDPEPSVPVIVQRRLVQRYSSYDLCSSERHFIHAPHTYREPEDVKAGEQVLSVSETVE